MFQKPQDFKSRTRSTPRRLRQIRAPMDMGMPISVPRFHRVADVVGTRYAVLWLCVSMVTTGV